jgi:hypothetical protein
LVDDANGYEWLVRDDGRITTLERDFDDVAPADPRLWFQCLAVTGHSSGGAPEPDDARMAWCALDPAADTVHVWGAPWDGSQFSGDDAPAAASPASGLAWGLRWVDELLVWWEADGSRRYHDLGPATASNVIANGPPGQMSFWSWSKGSDTLTVFTSSDRGASWQETDLVVPFRPAYSLELSWTPDGDLVGREDYAFFPDGDPHEGDGLRLWRAEFVDGDSFEVVYESRTGNQMSAQDLPFALLDGRLWASRLWSDDDGRTWQEVTTWRP